MKKPKEWSHVQAASLPLVWLTTRTSVERCEPYVKREDKRAVGDKTNLQIIGGSVSYLTNPQMNWRWFCGLLGWGERYDCINLDPRKDFLGESLQLPTDKIVIDSTFPFEDAKNVFEGLNTGRAKGKVVVEID